MIQNLFAFTDQCHVTEIVFSRKFLPKLLEICQSQSLLFVNCEFLDNKEKQNFQKFHKKTTGYSAFGNFGIFLRPRAEIYISAAEGLEIYILSSNFRLRVKFTNLSLFNSQLLQGQNKICFDRGWLFHILKTLRNMDILNLILQTLLEMKTKPHIWPLPSKISFTYFFVFQ